MTKQEHDEAKARCEVATGGPWFSGGGDSNPLVGEYDVWTFTPTTKILLQANHNFSKVAEDDARFTAHARADLPAALEMLERAMELVGNGMPTVQGACYDQIAADALLREWETVHPDAEKALDKEEG